MTDIEKVARAICIAMFGYDCVPNDGNLLAEPGSRLATVLRAAEAAIAAMQPAPQWYGIETAPRDGTIILLGLPIVGNLREVDRRVYEGRWHEEQKIFTSVNGFILLAAATHWMPLPTPPAGGSDAE